MQKEELLLEKEGNVESEVVLGVYQSHSLVGYWLPTCLIHEYYVSNLK